VTVTWFIRRASTHDLAVLSEIESESFSRPHWSLDDFQKYETILAETEHRVAGFLVSRQTFPAIQGGRPEREILNLAVARQFRRLGIATALLKYELSRKATYFLEVRESNVGACELYRKLGFEEIARRPNYYEFPTETAIVMKLK
jgi:[ribosomal protein S18]-alanine N-acetyltransferase